MHNDLKLTEPLDVHVRHVHTRPFLVLDAHRFTDALIGTISDPALRALPPVGTIDQYVDSTDLTDRNHTGRRILYIALPRTSHCTDRDLSSAAQHSTGRPPKTAV